MKMNISVETDEYSATQQYSFQQRSRKKEQTVHFFLTLREYIHAEDTK